ncbi:MAG: NADP-dependent phosphogluconate dehydrogenase [bacterium]
MPKQQIGLVGLAVMGENLALNIESKGFSVAVYNRTTEKVTNFIEGRAKGKNFVGATTPREFAAALEAPRRIILMVKAGDPVNAMIDTLKPHLEKGDILIDGGNSFFKDTARRGEALEAEGFRYIGAGVSGGEEGALRGPSIMPGGQRDAYDLLAPVLTKITAQVDDGPCCAYIGPGGAGHFVKMVHNGIEYGDKQLIAEAYDFLRPALGLPAGELGDIFNRWNEGVLQSYLIEITGKILKVTDEETGAPLVDFILDKAGQKGTGKWTSQTALDLGVATPTINAAVEARIISAFKDERVEASKIIGGDTCRFSTDRDTFVEHVHDALYASKICSYAQGMALMREASKEFGWDLNLSEIARIWKGGCIIRAKFLDSIRGAYSRRADLPNLLVDPGFRDEILNALDAWRGVVSTAIELGIPCPALSASLAYFDSYRRECLPQNLTQAQRDFFGAHTYRRTDRDGVFHTKWEE